MMKILNFYCTRPYIWEFILKALQIGILFTAFLFTPSGRLSMIVYHSNWQDPTVFKSLPGQQAWPRVQILVTFKTNKMRKKFQHRTRNLGS